MKVIRGGFSLLELSIVLVILGLLAGGVVIGQSMIKAAELRSIITEQKRYKTAISAFRDKYIGLPGDIKNATDFWGAAANCPGTNAQPSTDETTCNGNGDRMLESGLGAGYGNEPFRFWQQLANAGMLEGTYTGVQGADGADAAVIEENVPPGRVSRSGWSAVQIDYVPSGDATSFTNGAYQALVYGVDNGNAPTNGKVLTADEAFQIDDKMDDGKPAQGKVIAIYWDDCTLATANTETDALYAVLETDKECALHFKGFY